MDSESDETKNNANTSYNFSLQHKELTTSDHAASLRLQADLHYSGQRTHQREQSPLLSTIKRHSY